MKHIALTIGPIYKTLGLARKTRELWGASYFFSHIMKEILQELVSNNTSVKERILIPGTGDLDNTDNCLGAGLYPDRLIMEAQPGDFESLQTVIKNVLNRFAQENHIDESFFTGYFQAYSLEMDIPDYTNPIIHLSPYLDALELQNKCVTRDQENATAKFLTRKSFPACKMYKTAFTDETGHKQKRFPSLIEIATRELHRIDKDKYDKATKPYIYDSRGEEQDLDEQHQSVVQSLKKKFGRQFKTCHKYIAIVQADGDGIGSLIKNMGTDKTKLADFSLRLLDLARRSANLIADYDGIPVYLGGDDLLFFAPIVNPSVKIDHHPVPHILELSRLLDEWFRKEFPGALLSFGISITYNKFPMQEALVNARHLLFDTAKNHPGKNCAALEIQKHSGKTFGARLSLKSDSFKLFMEMLNTAVETEHLKSIAHHLTEYHSLLQVLGRNPETAEETIENVFDNAFDEDIHDKNRDFIDNTAKLLVTLFKESTTNSSAVDTLYTLLRVIQFFKRKDSDAPPIETQRTDSPTAMETADE